MKYASYFSFSFTTPFQISLWSPEGEETKEYKGFFMKLQASEALVYLTKSKEEDPSFQKMATHQLVCDASFPIERVKSWQVAGKSWILRDYTFMQDLYFLKLAPKELV